MSSYRFIEKILIVLSILGVIMKFTGMAGADLFIVIPLLLVALFYFSSGYFILRDRDSKANHRSISIAAGIFFALGILGMMLKLEYWPGAQLFLLTGIIGAVVLMNLAIAKRKKNNEDEGKDKYYRVLINKCSVSVVLCAVLFSIPQSTLIRIEYRDDPGFAQLKIDYMADPENNVKREKLYHYIMKKADHEPDLRAGDSTRFRLKH